MVWQTWRFNRSKKNGRLKCRRVFPALIYSSFDVCNWVNAYKGVGLNFAELTNRNSSVYINPFHTPAELSTCLCRLFYKLKAIIIRWWRFNKNANYDHLKNHYCHKANDNFALYIYVHIFLDISININVKTVALPPRQFNPAICKFQIIITLLFMI